MNSISQSPIIDRRCARVGQRWSEGIAGWRVVGRVAPDSLTIHQLPLTLNQRVVGSMPYRTHHLRWLILVTISLAQLVWPTLEWGVWGPLSCPRPPSAPPTVIAPELPPPSSALWDQITSSPMARRDRRDSGATSSRKSRVPL